MALQYRKGTCTSCEADQFIVKRSALLGQLCHTCNQERLQKDKEQGKSKTRTKRVSIPKVKDTSQKDLFLKLWKERDKVSFLSGKPLAHLENYKNNKELSGLYYSIFAHVLSKALNKYPKFKLKPENIILLSPEEHTMLDHGSESQREKYAKENNCDWNKVYKLRDKLKEEYNNL
jgi:hypothetical protein